MTIVEWMQPSGVNVFTEKKKKNIKKVLKLKQNIIKSRNLRFFVVYSVKIGALSLFHGSVYTNMEISNFYRRKILFFFFSSWNITQIIKKNSSSLHSKSKKTVSIINIQNVLICKLVKNYTVLLTR